MALLRDSSKECGVAQGLVRVSADPVYVDSLCGDFVYFPLKFVLVSVNVHLCELFCSRVLAEGLGP